MEAIAIARKCIQFDAAVVKVEKETTDEIVVFLENGYNYCARVTFDLKAWMMSVRKWITD